jgi:hypothetical protein
MSRWLNSLRSLTTRSARADHTAIGSDAFWAHQYFTDGARLYRLVGWIHRSVSGMVAELEDCLTLDILIVNVHELKRGQLMPVTALAAA